MADDVNLSQVAQDLPGLSGEKLKLFMPVACIQSDVGRSLDI